MQIEIYKNILWNISVLMILGFGIGRIPLIRHVMIQENPTVKKQLQTACIFAGLGILSTYMGVNIQGAIANTRVIGMVAGGLIGGPVTGITAGLIAGLHRYFIDIGGFTALACMISTILEGFIGGMFSHYLKKDSYNKMEIFFVTFIAEIVQMMIILIFAKPLEDAMRLVAMIFAPMVFVNSIGVVILITIIESDCYEQDRQSARSVRNVLQIARLCLPYLRKGLYDKEALETAAKIVIDHSQVSGVMLTDTVKIVAAKGTAEMLSKDDICFGEDGIARVIKNRKAHGGGVHLWISTPIMKKEKTVGTLILCSIKTRFQEEQIKEFATGLSNVFSTQLELSQLEYEQKLRKQAEYGALQSQINPHFLFNSLNTIGAFCRRDPAKARELLLALADCFRKTINRADTEVSIGEEMEHVHAYLKLEQARFGENLLVEEKITGNLEEQIPAFLLQPIVENAVKHGARKSREHPGKVWIIIEERKQDIRIRIQDNGPGIPNEIKQRLYAGELDRGHVGMQNVYHRLLSVYGEEGCFDIRQRNGKNEIFMEIPKRKQ